MDAESKSNDFDGMPRVTVVVLSYNNARYIEECLESIRGQTYPHIDLVIIDDGSKDASPEIIHRWTEAKWPDAELRVHADNRGLVHRCNEGLDLVQNEFYTLLGSDDRLRPHRLESQLKSMIGKPEFALCYSDMNVIDEFGVIISSSIVSDLESRGYNTPTPNNILDNVAGKAPYCSPTWLLRREAVDSVGGYDERFVNQEDAPLLLKLCQSWQVVRIKEPLVDYRMHSESISSQGIPRPPATLLAWCELLRELEPNGEGSDWRQLYENRVLYLLRTAGGSVPRRALLRHTFHLIRSSKSQPIPIISALIALPLALAGVKVPSRITRTSLRRFFWRNINNQLPIQTGFE